MSQWSVPNLGHALIDGRNRILEPACDWYGPLALQIIYRLTPIPPNGRSSHYLHFATRRRPFLGGQRAEKSFPSVAVVMGYLQQIIRYWYGFTLFALAPSRPICYAILIGMLHSKDMAHYHQSRLLQYIPWGNAGRARHSERLINANCR